MDDKPAIVQIIDIMRAADIRRRAVLLSEVADIERRWALGRFADQPPQISIDTLQKTNMLDSLEQ